MAMGWQDGVTQPDERQRHRNNQRAREVVVARSVERYLLTVYDGTRNRGYRHAGRANLSLPDLAHAIAGRPADRSGELTKTVPVFRTTRSLVPALAIFTQG